MTTARVGDLVQVTALAPFPTGLAVNGQYKVAFVAGLTTPSIRVIAPDKREWWLYSGLGDRWTTIATSITDN